MRLDGLATEGGNEGGREILTIGLRAEGRINNFVVGVSLCGAVFFVET